MRKIFLLLILLLLISFGCKKPAQKYIGQAIEKYHNQDYKGAIASYTRALEVDPKLPEAYYSRGLVKKAFRQNCIGIFIKPGKLNVIEPGSTAPFSYLEELFPFAAGEIDDYTMALTLNPGFADAYYHRAMAKFDIGQADSACIDLRKAQTLGNPDAEEQIQVRCSKVQ
ncbi:MAG: tetratricopeptide repeat protein [Bacteroidales bacterium]